MIHQHHSRPIFIECWMNGGNILKYTMEFDLFFFFNSLKMKTSFWSIRVFLNSFLYFLIMLEWEMKYEVFEMYWLEICFKKNRRRLRENVILNVKIKFWNLNAHTHIRNFKHENYNILISHVIFIWEKNSFLFLMAIFNNILLFKIYWIKQSHLLLEKIICIFIKRTFNHKNNFFFTLILFSLGRKIEILLTSY